MSHLTFESKNPNTGGAWTTPNLWNPDGTPGGNVLDTATLGNVTAGTRDVTLNAAQTIAAFNITQTTAGVVNKFTLTNTLTTTTHAFSSVSAANVGTLVMELGTNGVFATGGFNLTGTINFTGNNSGITKNSGGTLNLGNGQNAAINVNVGASNTATLLKSTANQGHTVQLIGNTAGSRVATLNVSSGNLLIQGSSSSNFGGSTVSYITGDNATTTVASGAELKLESGTASGATNSTTVASTVNTGGTFLHSGTVSFKNQNDISSGTQFIANNALYTIGSNTASIVRSSGGSTQAASVVTFNNNAAGTFTSAGGGAASSLTFTNNNGGSGALTRLAFNNLGTMAIGGTSTTGLTGVGSLTMSNVNYATTAANANTMAFQVGGSAVGTFDSLTISGTDSTFALGSTADTLTLSLVNSFTPVADFSVSLLNFSGGAAASGAFDLVTGIGAVAASSTLDVSAALGSFVSGDSWTFNNDSSTGNFGTLTYAIPEPTSAVMLLGGLGMLMALNRKRSRSSKI